MVQIRPVESGTKRLPLRQNIVWRSSEVRLFDTTILAAPEASQEAIDLAFTMSLLDERDLKEFTVLGGGSYAKVYDVGKYAVKVFSEDDTNLRRHQGSLSNIAANVALQKGLAQQSSRRLRSNWLFSAPEVFAAAFPNAGDDELGNITWVMERIRGVEPRSEAEVPDAMFRQQMYRDALDWAGLIAADVVLDDSLENMRVQFGRAGEKDRLVKFDVAMRHTLTAV